MHSCLITGANGFIGSALVANLYNKGDIRVVVACRNKWKGRPAGIEAHSGLECSGSTDWSSALGVDCVIHLAARVHIMNDEAADPLGDFRRVNVDGTLRLARQAASAGIKRFIFLSSIKVNGEATPPGCPFTADDVPAPVDPYGISKLEAERGLRALAGETGLEVVIVRPPLVYGPGVKANFLNMMRWLARGVPLPFGAIDNRRSLVALDNLVDLIVTCAVHPAAAGETFLAGDGEDLSTPELLRRMGRALGRPARLLPVPAALLEAGARALGQGALAQRLCGSLQVDIDKARRVLGWTPPLSVDAALERTARDFLGRRPI